MTSPTDAQQDVFFHFSELLGSLQDTIKVGTELAYELTTRPRSTKLVAIRIKEVEPGTAKFTTVGVCTCTRFTSLFRQMCRYFHVHDEVLYKYLQQMHVIYLKNPLRQKGMCLSQ